MQRIVLVFLFISCLSVSLYAQEGRSTFDYLLLPASPRSAALGGTNISAIENDVSFIYNNPGLLGAEMDKTLNVNFLSYVGDVLLGNATFARAINDRSTWGVGVNYTNYGKMLETTENNEVLGDLNANDLCANLFFAHDLTDKIRGGITGKFLYSNYYHNTAIGLGVDLGLSYYNADNDLSIGLVAKNLGRQVKAYEEELVALPWDIQLGISKRLPHAPIRFSLTGVYLKQWKFKDLHGNDNSFWQNLGKHLIVGVDIIPTDNLWIAVGYNIKRGIDMHLDNGNKFAGFSIGAGLRVKNFNVGCSYGQYHPSNASLMFSISTSFAETSL